jgi:PAS domain S-box-containing protein
VAETTGKGSVQRASEVAQLRQELAEARARIEKLTAQLAEQEGLSRRVEHARAAWAQTLDALMQPIFMHDEKGCIVRANRAYAERAGVPVTNLTGKVYWKLFPLRDTAFPVEAAQTGDTGFEFPLSRDEVFLVRSVGASAGLPPSWRLYIFQDITALKRAEAAARASAQIAGRIVESSRAMIVAVDRERRIGEFNPAAEQEFGYRRDEVLGKHVNMLYADPVAGDGVRQTVLERGGAVVEIVNRRKSGELFTSLLSAALLRDAEGKVLGVVGASVDVTERKEAEAKVKAALAELELTIENAPAGLAVVKDRVIERVNRRFAEMLGYDRRELIGKSTELIYPGRTEYEALGREAYPQLANGRTYETTLQLKRKDGSLFWAHLAGRAADDEREHGKSIWVADDVTERQTLDEGVRRREAYFRGLVEHSGDVIVVVNAEGTVRYESPGIERMLGYRDTERIGHSSFELVHPDDLAELGGAYRRILRGEAQRVTVEFRARHRDGDWHIVEATASGVFEGDGEKVGIANLRDVTERRRAERRCQESMEGAIAAIAAAVEMRDPYAAGHHRNVDGLAVAIARELGLDAERMRGLRLAAVVHDIGNIQVPDEILAKPGKLTALEYAFVQTHPQAGHDMLKNIDFPWPVAEIVLQHHELLDGSGYPRGLKGDEILLEARILAVANVVAAMTAQRAFLPAAGIDTALTEITRGRGTKFDPQAVDACVRLFREHGYSFDKR